MIEISAMAYPINLKQTKKKKNAQTIQCELMKFDHTRIRDLNQFLKQL